MIFFAELQLFFLLIIPNIYSSEYSKIIHHYEVRVSDDISRLYVKAQFGSSDIFTLYANAESSAENTHNMRLTDENQEKRYKPADSELYLRQNASQKTLYYEYDLSTSSGSNRWSSKGKVGNDVVIPPGMWLWRPGNLAENEKIEVEFKLPKGLNVSVPWEKTDAGRYRINDVPYDWPTAGAFGTFDTDTIVVPGAKLAVAMLDGDYKVSKNEIREWLKGAALSICNVYGEFPRETAQLLVIPVGKRSEAVPFAMVVRGGGYTVQFYIDPSRPISEFISDWTTTHELSHGLIPFIDRSEAWLSEGLATYYQYVLMGRDKRLDERDAWQRMYNGFQKGIRNAKGMTIKETAENMGRYRAYRFVYWCGAAMMLKADVALRKKTANRQSLDAVLKKVRDSILPETRSWGGYEMMQEMDRLSSTNIFSEIYYKNIYKNDFPLDDEYLEQLGITIKNDKVYLSDDAPLAQIRKGIIPPDNINID